MGALVALYREVLSHIMLEPRPTGSERRRIFLGAQSRQQEQHRQKIIAGPGCSLEGLMLKLKLQYFGHLMRRADSLKKTLMLGKIEGRRRKG